MKNKKIAKNANFDKIGNFGIAHRLRVLRDGLLSRRLPKTPLTGYQGWRFFCASPKSKGDMLNTEFTRAPAYRPPSRSGLCYGSGRRFRQGRSFGALSFAAKVLYLFSFSS